MSADRTLLIILAVVLATVVIGTSVARAWRRLRARSRQLRARRGERDAERLLARAGWIVEARQVARTLRFEVDGAPAEAHVRCDLLVRRGARRCVAEVKTGALAPRLDHAPTRRQLLEYRLAFDVDGVLLVDAESERVMEVRFPLATARRSSAALWLVGGGLLAGAALGAITSALLR
ncbi:hypothetical protein [Sandaracinus amylolyticus]|uniref:Uncharacterized protein n=1 Tax=Sandaracinus amylolyticus TaxID=927083 RepID=A0A0F6YHJ0_9BACT|nr:hypothetical protein [Sandaracinus amylolyticus]AKF04082.1 hypothetical protein DB32_001231 [Sandaracinus amylolyticus]